jgi:hypothetical protein
LDRLVNDPSSRALVMVNVGSQLHADVIIYNGTVSREFNEPKGGKMSILIDPETGRFSVETYRKRRLKPA